METLTVKRDFNGNPVSLEISRDDLPGVKVKAYQSGGGIWPITCSRYPKVKGFIGKGYENALDGARAWLNGIKKG